MNFRVRCVLYWILRREFDCGPGWCSSGGYFVLFAYVEKTFFCNDPLFVASLVMNLVQERERESDVTALDTSLF